MRILKYFNFCAFFGIAFYAAANDLPWTAAIWGALVGIQFMRVIAK